MRSVDPCGCDTGTCLGSADPPCKLAAGLPHSGRIGAQPPDAAARALEFFPQYVLEHHFVQRQVRHQPLQPNVLLLQLLQLAHLVDL